MGYYDGNTVTGLWNYAQHFAMSDNSYNTIFGPSTPGLLNLVAGQTNGSFGNSERDGKRDRRQQWHAERNRRSRSNR